MVIRWGCVCQPGRFRGFGGSREPRSTTMEAESFAFNVKVVTKLSTAKELFQSCYFLQSAKALKTVDLVSRGFDWS